MLLRSTLAPPPRRQAVILLIVVILLSLFLVVGLSFVLYAESEATASRIYREAFTINYDRADIPADELLKWALGQLVYDVANLDDGVYSAMRGHSLGRSAFGWRDPATTTAPGVNSNTVAFNGIGRLDGSLMSLPPELAGAKAQLLINHTYFPNYQSPGRSYIRDPEHAGYRLAQTGTLQAALALPAAQVGTTSSQPQPYTGGWNVPYTFPDHNNVFLAALRASDPAPSGTPRVTRQSFHRAPPGSPFHVANPNAFSLTNPAPWLDTANPALKYMVLRPRPVDMYWGGPNDPHSFPLPASDTGDVQNLPGGIGYDSFFMDLGYPVQATRGGRKFKPLFAFLVVDMDGRVNVNVHGNMKLDGTGGPNLHASNQGVGKHEVNLEKVFTAQPSELRNLFTGNITMTPPIRGRYGDGAVAGQGGQPGIGAPTMPALYPDPYAPNAFGLKIRPSYLAPVDFDGTDDNATPQQTMRYNVPAGYLTFPSYGTGYDGMMTQQSLTNNPLLYNSLNVGRDPAPFPAGSPDLRDRQFLMAENLYYLIGSASGPNHERAAMFNLGLKQNLALPRIRQMLTTHSYDLDTPGAMPWVIDPSQSPYRLEDQQPHPTAQGGFQLPRVPSQVNGVDFIQGGDGRCSVLPRLDMNRRLAPYPANPTQYPGTGTPPDATRPPDPTELYYRAVWERQNFAREVFERLVRVTGATPLAGATAGTPEFNALRYLAQLAVNIVDSIDDDEFNTPFLWKTASGAGVEPEWVFGVESPKVVLNEIYAEIRNDPADTAATGATQPYKVHFCIELFNTHKKAQLPNGTDFPNDPLTNANPATALLKSSNGNQVYRIRIFDDQGGFNPQDMRKADNIVGEPVGITPKLTTGDWVNPGFTNSAGADVKLIQPNDGSAAGPEGDNRGFYVVCSDQEIEGATPTVKPTNRLQSSGTIGLSYTEPLAGQQVPRRTHAVLLQRLACPHLPVQENKALPAYNPYITVDYVTGVPTNDAVKEEPFIAGVPSPHAGYQSFDRRTTKARSQPFAATRDAPAPQTPPHTFFNHNSTSPQFDWLVHLDRAPVSAMELLHVTPFKSHEVTQVFATSPSAHIAPWANDSTRLYRIFEYLTVGDRGNWTFQPAGLGTTTQPSMIGRTPGRININTVWDRAVFDALTDPQPPNFFNGTTAVNSAWDAIEMRRLTPVGTNSSEDVPYLGFATPATQNGVVSGKQAGHAGTPLANNEFGYNSFPPPAPPPAPQTPEYIKRELLTKIANNFGVRSNVFAVYVTVGFFEVIDDTVRPVKLGAEIRTRNGIPIRHKMFSVVDRTNLAVDPAANVGTVVDAHIRQPNKAQFFVTSEDGVSEEEINRGTPVALRIVGGIKYGDFAYDGQQVSVVQGGLPLGLGQFYMYADVGEKREKVICQIQNGQLIVQVGAGSGGLTRTHAAGFSLSYIQPGNPGPQGRIEYSQPRYKQVIPYATVIQ